MKTLQRLKNLAQVAVLITLPSLSALASSHREAPMIADDPLADNTDVYAFRIPDDPNSIMLIANYVPFQLPHGGPNYYTFGENIRYEIRIDNNLDTPGDDIIYRFTFSIIDEDPTTFFNIRLGLQNRKTSYTLEKSTDGGSTFAAVITNGTVPPYNVGERSITSPIGLGTDYATLMASAITTASSGETVFCGPTDDPFFVDLGGIFDLGNAPRMRGVPRDGLACKNVHTIAIKVPIAMLQKDGKDPSMAVDILDSDFVIGVWASASRRAIRTLQTDGSIAETGEWIQVSRLGMPLTNEVVIPIGTKDYWNSLTPYNEDPDYFSSFYNPELALYMDDDLFGPAVPAFSPLRVQRNSLGAFDFGNGQDGLFGLKGSSDVAGTALDDALFGNLLLPGPGQPRSVDLWPIFHTGVPNVRPYQLATGKGGDPLAAGKPFVNNFLPNGGDMLRLNMAVPPTDRDDPAFSTLGLIQAAVLGLTDPLYTSTTDLQWIPNMDGFPNGRRLEDDVTRIELQAVAGVVLAAIGLWYDDYDPSDPMASVLTDDLFNVLGYTTGIEENDAPFNDIFPFVAMPWSGTGKCSGEIAGNLANCGEPNALLASSITENSAVLSWSDEGVNNYQIRYRNTSSGGPVTTTLSSGNNVTISDLDPCSTYEFLIKIKCPRTGVFTSATSTFTTSGCLRTADSDDQLSMDFFPNPAINSLSVSYTMVNSDQMRVRIHDLTGRIMLETLTNPSVDGSGTMSLDLSSLPSGQYYLQLIQNDQQLVRQFAVMK